MKLYRNLLLASVFFLCACTTANKDVNNPAAITRAGNINTYRLNRAESSSEKAINTGAGKPKAILRNGSAKTYRRSGIEAISGSAAENALPLTTAERTKRISDLTTEIKGVDEATAVISGNMAIIGLKTVGHLDDMMLLKLKKEIENIIKEADDKIFNVAVTVKPDLVNRVSKITRSETSKRKGA